MSFRGYPDWHGPMSIGGHRCYPAYEQPGRFYAAPQGLVAHAQDGKAALQVDVYQQDRQAAGLAEFALLSLRFAADFELMALRKAAVGVLATGNFEALPVEAGLLRLRAAAALSLPDEVSVAQPLDVVGVGSMTLGMRLDAMAAEVFIAALRRGLSTLGAHAWMVARGVAARSRVRADFDPAALLAALGPGEGEVGLFEVSALLDRLTKAPEACGIVFSPSPSPSPSPAPVGDDDAAAAAAQALLDRLLGRYATLADAPAGKDGVWVRLAREQMTPARLTWRLDEPVLAPRYLALQADPLGALRQLEAADFEREVVRRHSVPALASGWQRLSIDTTATLPLLGATATVVAIEVPPRPPQRPTTIKRSLMLESDALPAVTDLRLAPGETLAYRWQTQVFVGSAPINGPERESDRRHLTVTPADFGVQLVRIDADAGWLAMARTEIECRGARPGGEWQVSGVLDPVMRALVVAVPPDVSDATMAARAAALSGGAVCRMSPAPLRPTRLDPFSFDGTGLRSLEVRLAPEVAAAEAAGAVSSTVIELCPQDATDDPACIERIRLSPEHPAAQWTWLVLSPFTTGYRWRRAGAADWSAPAQPDAALVVSTLSDHPGDLMAAAIDVIDGVRLRPQPDRPGHWNYVPTRPGLAAGADGRPQFTLIEAGPATMLALTATWGLTEQQAAGLRAQLAQQLSHPVTALDLSPAPVQVIEAALLIGDGKGGFHVLATSTGSGAPPYHAAFNLMLDEAGRAAVKRALSGDRGWLAVRYTVNLLPDRPAAQDNSRSSSRFAASVSRTTSTAGDSETVTGSMRVEAADEQSQTQSSNPSATETFQADAVDWGLLRP